jgi:putative ABC transport system ATP-binding protein
MIKLDAVDKVYRTDRIETTALRNINIQITPGEFVSIMGPSGSGKSTLLHVMGLLDVPSRGRVRIGDHEIDRVGDRALARIRNQQIGFVFQTFHLIGDLTVLDNVEIPLLYRALPWRERRGRALAALERVGLTSRVRHYPGQLSGGQQQRVAIARAIVGRPHIVLADEPTGNLDSQMGDEIMSVLQDLNQQEHTTIVMVTHDPRQAEKTDRILRLFDGRQVN